MNPAPSAGINKNHVVVAINSNTKEYKNVYHTLTATLPNIKVDSIQRIENFKQWEQYSVKKKDVASHNANTPNEKFVYLGVDGSVNLLDVFSCGFIDTRQANPNATKGGSVWFKINPSKADQEAIMDNKNQKQMFFFRTITGKAETNTTGNLTGKRLPTPPV
jgi:hypothetical protein